MRIVYLRLTKKFHKSTTLLFQVSAVELNSVQMYVCDMLMFT